MAWVLLAGTALSGCKDSQSAAPIGDERRPVRAATVHYADQTSGLILSATIVPRFEPQLGFQVGGRIAERLVDVGAQVTAGQVLARLDPENVEAQLRNARAGLAAAEAELTRTRADLARSQALRGSPAFIKASHDQRLAAAAAAQAHADQARAQITLAENQRAYAVLTAPADGVVSAVLAEAGQVVSAGQAVLRLAQSGEKELLAYIPEHRLAEATPALTVSATLWGGGETLSARLRERAPLADPTTRTYAARFTILAPPADLALGRTATVRSLNPAGAKLAKLPPGALFQDGRQPAVWQVNPADGSLKLLPVTVAAWRDDGVLISGGVADGAMIVTAGVHKLDAAQRVRLLAEVR